MRYILLVILSLFLSQSYSQNTQYFNDSESYYRSGLDLLDKGHYGSAREVFENYLNDAQNSPHRADAEYYIAYCALGLYHNDGEKRIENFIDEHPDHPKALTAYYDLGTFYFKEKEYKKAAEYYSKVNLNLITEEERDETRFNLGYSLFSQRKFNEAIEYFNVLKNKNTQYSAASSYYAGYIEYENKEYQKAIIDLERAGKDEAYASVAPELLATLYYKQGRYDDLIAYGESVGVNSVSKAKDLNLMLGDAYLYKNKTTKAVEAYKKAENSRALTRDERYRVGYAYYKEKDFEKSIFHFKQTASDKDSIGVYSGYYLGIMYLSEGNKLYSKTAFYNTRENKINAQLREEGAYQYAKVCYDLGLSEEAINGFNYYLDNYTSGKYTGEISDLLSEAYLSANSYELAIAHIEKQKSISKKLEGVYQKANYLKATELFNKGNYRESIEFFKKSLRYPNDAQIKYQANLWIGEAYSIGRRYDDAIPVYQNVVGAASVVDNATLNQARYGLGYAYYNSKKYDKALLYFKAYTTPEASAKGNKYYHDGLIRLADCYYVSKEYNSALTYYKKASTVSRTDLDYVMYQSGVIHGIEGDLTSALASLDQVIKIKDSRYIDDAIYQKGQMNFEKGNYQQAITSFTQLINNHSNSRLVPYALLRRGSAYYNEKNYSNTIQDYTNLIENHPTHPTAKDVLLPLQESLNLANRGSEFDAMLAEYKTKNPDKKGLENVEFETAKNFYFNLDYKKAITRFNDFVSTYPEDPKVSEAKYYAAESHYRLREYDAALDIYNQLFTLSDFQYKNRVVGRIAEIEYSSGRYQNAIYFYRELNSMASSKKDKYNVWAGLMESYFYLSKYDSVKRYANIILDEGNVHISSQNKALLYLGKSSYAKGDFKQAEDEFLATLNNARDVFGAEAQYMLGQIYFQQKNYKKSVEALIDLSKNLNAYNDWVGKGYMLMSDAYLAMGDTFQAKGTLKSVADNFPDEFYRKKAAQKIKEIEKVEQQKENEIIKSDSLIIDN
ncbi:tetratricopeptide repeat protein [Fulvivirga lutea]|uniref:Tetratricopeptide repeat protein n=1 Tax=Fulvivirga lutea TaxID=2810512 RepID=A0A975A0E0_9BACT|nr:tetratricopeptide repeat protein [Fulvivirga lutea]QSE96716.1 tetratricopeptide repeat protein [Fulvivirga lutea]